MKKDKFDDFIKNHRQLFDDIEQAPPAFRIEKKLVPVTKLKVLYTLWAASIAAIIVLSFLLYEKSSYKEPVFSGLSYSKKNIRIKSIDSLHIDTNITESDNETKYSKVIKPAKDDEAEHEVNIIADELIEAYIYYSQEIETKQNELLLLTTSTPQIYQAVYADITELENVFLELSKDLADNIDNQQVVEAMIQNYRLRLMILEGVVQQIKNQTVNNKNSKGYEF